MAQYLKIEVMNANVTNGDVAYSDAFTLKDSRFFSLEWENAGAYQFDAELQMMCSDEATWIAATSGSAILTNQTSQRGFVDMSPPYSRNRFRIKITNDDASTRRMKLWVHMNASGRV